MDISQTEVEMSDNLVFWYWTPCWALIDSTTTKYKQQKVSNSNGGELEINSGWTAIKPAQNPCALCS